MQLLTHIEKLEKFNDQERFNYILQQLVDMDVQFKLQQYEGGTNIIVPAAQSSFVIVSSHFDTVRGTPGANDNASAIAVCLELLRKKKESPILIDFQVIFFDEEEVGLRGSKAYCNEFGIKNCLGLLNMELVGMGDRFALWPLNFKSKGTVLHSFETAAMKQGIDCFRIDKIVTNSADHKSFLNAGLKNVFTITCISQTDMMVAAEYIQAIKLEASKEVILEIMQKAPIFQHYHQPTDLSDKLSEATLKMTLDTIWDCLLAV